MKTSSKLLLVASFVLVALSFAASPAAAACDGVSSDEPFCLTDQTSADSFAVESTSGVSADISCQNSPYEFCTEGIEETVSDVSTNCPDCYDCPLCGIGSLSVEGVAPNRLITAGPITA